MSNYKYEDYSTRVFLATDCLLCSGTKTIKLSINSNDLGMWASMVLKSLEQRGWEYIENKNEIETRGGYVVQTTKYKKTITGSDGKNYDIYETTDNVIGASYLTHSTFFFSRDLINMSNGLDIMKLEQNEMKMMDIESEISKEYSDFMQKIKKEIDEYQKEKAKRKNKSDIKHKRGEYTKYDSFINELLPFIIVIPGLAALSWPLLFVLSNILTFVDMSSAVYNPIYQLVATICAGVVVLIGLIYLIRAIVLSIKVNTFGHKVTRIYTPNPTLYQEFEQYLNDSMSLYKKLKIKKVTHDVKRFGLTKKEYFKEKTYKYKVK